MSHVTHTCESRDSTSKCHDRPEVRTTGPSAAAISSEPQFVVGRSDSVNFSISPCVHRQYGKTLSMTDGEKFNMAAVKFTLEQKREHLLNWVSQWRANGEGRSMWSYSLSLGGSHALLNGWSKSEIVLSLLTPEERDSLNETLRQAARSGRMRTKSASARDRVHRT